MNKLTEQKQSSVLKHVLKVIYAPHKAFKEITQNPKLIGPILVMALFVAASLGTRYIQATKMYVQQTLPNSLDLNNRDPWTETAAMWQSNANITTIASDRLLGAQSIQFDVSNDTLVWAELKDIGTINCSSNEGYNNLTFGMKWIHTSSIVPRDINLFLYSNNSTEYFRYSITEHENQTVNDQWSNYTVLLGPSIAKWINSSSQASWDNVTSLRIEATWDDFARSNLTIRVDATYFLSDRFEQLSGKIVENASMYAFLDLMNFAMNWILTSVTLLIVARFFTAVKTSKTKAELKTFLIIAGYSLIVFVFMQLIFSIFYIANPALYFSLETVTPSSALQNLFLLDFYATLLIPIWAIILSVFGLRAAFELTTKSSIILAVIGYIPYYALWYLSYLQ